MVMYTVGLVVDKFQLQFLQSFFGNVGPMVDHCGESSCSGERRGPIVMTNNLR